jgi:secretion/DNA translocation related TadE-like protein
VRPDDAAAKGAIGRTADAGSASIWLLAFAMVLWVAAAGAVAMAGAVTARHRAASAADLAALAGAQELARAITADSTSDSTASACAAAGATATANHATLVSCAATGAVVDVVAAVQTTGIARLAALATTVRAHARAGPVVRPSPSSDQLAGGAPDSRVSSNVIAPALSSGSLPLPHFGDWTHDGQPFSQPHDAIASRVARSQVAAAAYPRSAKPAPP